MEFNQNFSVALPTSNNGKGRRLLSNGTTAIREHWPLILPSFYNNNLLHKTTFFDLFIKQM